MSLLTPSPTWVDDLYEDYHDDDEDYHDDDDDDDDDDDLTVLPEDLQL